jgi:hypothetical protein
MAPKSEGQVVVSPTHAVAAEIEHCDIFGMCRGARLPASKALRDIGARGRANSASFTAYCLAMTTSNAANRVSGQLSRALI